MEEGALIIGAGLGRATGAEGRAGLRAGGAVGVGVLGDVGVVRVIGVDAVGVGKGRAVGGRSPARPGMPPG